MADGTPDVQGSAKLPGNSDGIDLDAVRNGGATPSLAAFVAAYNEDDNIWWVLGCGHHQNLFEEAVDEVERLRAENEVAHQQADTAVARAFEFKAERDAALARIRAVGAIITEMSGYLEAGRSYRWTSKLHAALAVQPEDGGE